MDELGDEGRAAWAAAIARCRARLEAAHGPNPDVLTMPDARTPWTTTVDWTGLPVRVVRALTRAVALRRLDDRALQEEYLEWRVVRGERGRIVRVELTTELAEYWDVLTAFAPERARRLRDELQEHAGPSPAIVCMTQPSNSLHALLRLVLAATRAVSVCDEATGRERCAAADEVIPQLGDDAAVAGRGSDPVLVERLGRLAHERRLVALDEPVGAHMQSIEHTRLLAPGGEPVPPEWIRFARGTPGVGDTPARWQRLVVACPPRSGLTVSDLVDAATEQPIRFGGQIADLVQVAVALRVSDPGVTAGHGA